MTYIIGKFENAPVETIDAFDTHREALKMLTEYQLSFGRGWSLWVSTRPTKDWRE